MPPLPKYYPYSYLATLSFPTCVCPHLQLIPTSEPTGACKDTVADYGLQVQGWHQTQCHTGAGGAMESAQEAHMLAVPGKYR